MSRTSAFRHDPGKSVLTLPGKAGRPSRWSSEPAVCGHRRLTHVREDHDRPIPVPVCATPAVVVGAGVVVAGYDGYVSFHSRFLDKVYWSRRLDSPVYASLVVDADRRRVVAAATSGLVVCFDLRGRRVWSTNVEVPVYATPTLLPEEDVLVIAAFGGRCVGLDLDSGALLFNRSLREPWHAGHGGSAAGRDPYASPAATAEGSVIVCCAEHVLCLAPDGTELWSQDLGHSVRASPVVLNSQEQVVAFSVDGRCHFLAGGDGRWRGEVELGGKIIASPAVSGDVLAVGTQNDVAFGIDVRTREIVWRSPGYAPREYTSFTVLPDGNFAATSARGNAVGLSRSDGRFLWETSQVLGLADHDPAMDITPVAGSDGSMYCGSYSGMLYHFLFRPEGEVENA
ncbi:PQQ-binding-like beta-propeller repeat protein [Streptosporangium sp. NBC_01639]|uniref:outer membrane protein assembly factor BamB family protein n=1 Tax=Streptosporangium sp. NBC_01639 TaxID=2975948 RepID=UPI00386E0A58|nr:PQQ-binding-like beta-propeller repeat protein [Streptosporangium sp. NBC_01639]